MVPGYRYFGHMYYWPAWVHLIVIALMGVEMMLNAANLVLVTFARINSNVDGEIMAFFVMVVAAAEVVVGLSIIVSIYRSRSTTSMDDLNLLKN